MREAIMIWMEGRMIGFLMLLICGMVLAWRMAIDFFEGKDMKHYALFVCGFWTVCLVFVKYGTQM